MRVWVGECDVQEGGQRVPCRAAPKKAGDVKGTAWASVRSDVASCQRQANSVRGSQSQSEGVGCELHPCSQSAQSARAHKRNVTAPGRTLAQWTLLRGLELLLPYHDMNMLESVLDALFLTTAWAHVLLAPYTKVEESFSLHATHDVLMYGLGPGALAKVRDPFVSRFGNAQTPIPRQYDHFTFPGAVPRSFIGSIALAWISTPVLYLASFLGYVSSKADVQLTSMSCSFTSRVCS